jgi:Glyoxalase/Bleomycin resistance protein/Dioxygenase superfamily
VKSRIRYRAKGAHNGRATRSLRGILLTHFLVAEDVARSAAFYSEVLGGEIVMAHEPSIVQIANSWLVINVGGGPTDDKPEVILETPPDPSRTSAFLNIRVADFHAVYEEWGSRGAEFRTSTVPQRAAGTRAACLSASSRSAHSRM